ncbi:outer membrane protein insertion porin family [Allopseudospirillum japonicum]|uniref:Outer membrane protein assembly factor BamA n=1 Tax=Allopseudospirillum japonicum TaxID=64971 RepID=A0A1H6R2L2_9GAMM|nr:outer membrane protein assembly factor BamA [Allopseudospirillum japonicum]SEI50061.1 outer membrane protein insertion porin family [Allopseudospirillum japonicum]
MKKTPLYLAWALLGAAPVMAQTPDRFVVEDIRVQGLQRVSAGTVFAQFPVSVQQEVDAEQLARAAKFLFKSGLFDDVRLARDGQVLVLQVRERPTIAKIELEGNDQLDSEELLAGLTRAGLQEGQVFQRATLADIQQELERLYHAQGRYSARIQAKEEALDGNRVRIEIDINEGSVARIKHINLLGNQVFDDDTLLDLFELEAGPSWHWFYTADQYSRERLKGDLETLRSYYFDRGYLQFKIESTQVALSPTKDAIYLNIAMQEGPQYQVDTIELAGDLVLTEAELRALIQLTPGQTFSRSLMTASTEALRQRLGNEGYTFANVNALPQLDEATQSVKLVFFVDPGRRNYVRRIRFSGNTGTMDEVLRRELIQMEGGWASTEQIQQSRVRLERLGFFKQVEVETLPVAGRPDQVDVHYRVEEQAAGSISASVGYSQSSGIVYGLQISQRNFLGTGNRVTIAAQRSDYRDSYTFSYYDPYYTQAGVSRGFSLFYRATDYEEGDVSNFTTDTYGASLTYGYPLSEDSRLSFSLGFDQTEVKPAVDVVQEVSYFLEQEGDSHFAYKLTGRWIQNRLNRGILATAGSYQSVSLEVATPGSDLTFYKLNYRGQKYFPLGDDWSIRVRTDLGYGDAYGSQEWMPFYEHYYSGGLGSVRGYKSNSIGPRTTPSLVGGDTDPFGGNFLVEASLELIYPLPFVQDQRSLQTSAFIDAGGVYNSACYPVSDACESGFHTQGLRYSAGVGLTWLTGIGPLTFSIAKALNAEADDDTEVFQFSLGQTF